VPFVDYAGPTFEVVDRKTGEVRDRQVSMPALFLLWLENRRPHPL